MCLGAATVLSFTNVTSDKKNLEVFLQTVKVLVEACECVVQGGSDKQYLVMGPVHYSGKGEFSGPNTSI